MKVCAIMLSGRLSRAGHDLFFTTQGPTDGITVLFIHGFSCDMSDFSFQVPYLLQNYPQLRLITSDLRNHGFSRYIGPTESTNSTKLDMKTADLAADAAAILTHAGACETNKAVVIAHSLGGVVATELCHAFPQLTRGLVLLDAAHLAPPGSFAQILKDMRGPHSDEAIAAYFESVYTPDTPDFLKTWHAMRAWGLEQPVAVSALESMIDYIGLDNVELIKRTYVAGVPRLVVVSTAAFLEPLKQAAGPDSGNRDDTFEVMEVGHWMMKTDAPGFNEILSKWLADYILS